MKNKKKSIITRQYWLDWFEIFSYYFIFCIVGALAVIRCIYCIEEIDNVATLLAGGTFLCYFWARWSERKRWKK